MPADVSMSYDLRRETGWGVRMRSAVFVVVVVVVVGRTAIGFKFPGSGFWATQPSVAAGSSDVSEACPNVFSSTSSWLILSLFVRGRRRRDWAHVCECVTCDRTWLGSLNRLNDPDDVVEASCGDLVQQIQFFCLVQVLKGQSEVLYGDDQLPWWGNQPFK